MQRFNEKNPGESVVLTFNFTLGLPFGVLLTGMPVFTITLLYGTDLNPAAMINGSPAVDETGMLVLMPVIGGIDLNDYLATMQCPTTNSDWVLTLPAVLPVRAYPSTVGAP